MSNASEGQVSTENIESQTVGQTLVTCGRNRQGTDGGTQITGSKTKRANYRNKSFRGCGIIIQIETRQY